MKYLLKLFFVILLIGFTNNRLDSYYLTNEITPCKSDAQNLFDHLNLQSIIPYDAFQKSLEALDRFNFSKSVIAICDFTKPSNEKRFTVIDLNKKELIEHTYVAHGKNSGSLSATEFSNEHESLKSSKGFFRIAEKIISPKHGQALMLDGLEKGINDNARLRQIIMHGADYVSDKFIDSHGRLGRSFGCPALPREEMKNLIPILNNGALLYIYTKS